MYFLQCCFGQLLITKPVTDLYQKRRLKIFSSIFLIWFLCYGVYERGQNKNFENISMISTILDISCVGISCYRFFASQEVCQFNLWQQ